MINMMRGSNSSQVWMSIRTPSTMNQSSTNRLIYSRVWYGKSDSAISSHPEWRITPSLKLSTFYPSYCCLHRANSMVEMRRKLLVTMAMLLPSKPKQPHIIDSSPWKYSERKMFCFILVLRKYRWWKVESLKGMNFKTIFNF